MSDEQQQNKELDKKNLEASLKKQAELTASLRDSLSQYVGQRPTAQGAATIKSIINRICGEGTRYVISKNKIVVTVEGLKDITIE